MLDFKNKKVAIWGFGTEGQSAFNYLSARGVKASIITDENISNIFTFDYIIKSPGISIYDETYTIAKEKGITITSGTDLFLQEVKSLAKRPVLIAITGTKGKSTTSALLAHILLGLGKQVKLGGNFGVPLLDFIPDVMEEPSLDYVIAEVSSYQASDLTNGFDIAVLNNLYPEHLNWHRTHQNYYKDKINLINKSKVKVLNYQDELTNLLVDKGLSNILYFNNEDVFHHSNGKLFYKDNEILSLSDTLLTGEHNLSNLSAVCTVLLQSGFDVVGEDKKAIQESVKSFTPLPHRLEKVAEKDSFIFIDDSISTTEETAMAALDSFKDYSITLLAGGFDRGQSYKKLAEKIKQNNVRLVAMKTTGKRLFDEVSKINGMAVLVDDMGQAVQTAKEISPKGSVILLSPAAPSYDFYNNFQERGFAFQSFI